MTDQTNPVYMRLVRKVVEQLDKVNVPVGRYLIDRTCNPSRDPKTNILLDNVLDWMLQSKLMLQQLHSADGPKWWLTSRGAAYDRDDREIILVTAGSNTAYTVIQEEQSPADPVPQPPAQTRVEPTVEAAPSTSDPSTASSAAVLSGSTDNRIKQFVRMYEAEYKKPPPTTVVSAIVCESTGHELRIVALRIGYLVNGSVLIRQHLDGYECLGTKLFEGAAAMASRRAVKAPAVQRVAKPVIEPLAPEPAPLDNKLPAPAPATCTTLGDAIDICWTVDQNGALSAAATSTDEWVLILSVAQSQRLADFILKTQGLFTQCT